MYGLFQMVRYQSSFQSLKNIHQDLTVESLISAGHGDPIICKLEPFRACYRFDETGRLYPVGNRRPVRLIRVYKRTTPESTYLFGFDK